MRFRLYHKELIDVLPGEELVEQWRQLSAIAGFIRHDGTTHDEYVEEIMNYDLNHFITYAAYVHDALIAKGFKVNQKVWNKIKSLKPNYIELEFDKIFDRWMNDEDYFLISYYALREKYKIGKISIEDMEAIEKRADEFFNWFSTGRRE